MPLIKVETTVFVCPLPASCPPGRQLTTLRRRIYYDDAIDVNLHVALPGAAIVAMDDATAKQLLLAIDGCFPAKKTVLEGSAKPFVPELALSPVPCRLDHRDDGYSTIYARQSLSTGVHRSEESSAAATEAYHRGPRTEHAAEFVFAVFHDRPTEATLWVPLKAAAGPGTSDGACPPSDAAAADPPCPHDVTIYSVGTMRRGLPGDAWSGGGKTSAQVMDNLRHRFATGSFNKLLPPKLCWEEARLRRGVLPLPDEVRALFSLACLLQPSSYGGPAAAAAPRAGGASGPSALDHPVGSSPSHGWFSWPWQSKAPAIPSVATASPHATGGAAVDPRRRAALEKGAAEASSAADAAAYGRVETESPRIASTAPISAASIRFAGPGLGSHTEDSEEEADTNAALKCWIAVPASGTHTAVAPASGSCASGILAADYSSPSGEAAPGHASRAYELVCADVLRQRKILRCPDRDLQLALDVPCGE